MKFLKLKRVIGEGWTSFRRNSWLTVAAISVLSLSLFIIGSTLLVGMSANVLIENIEKNVNINVYFKNSVSEERIAEIKREVEKKSELSSVEYISKEDALEKFSLDIEGNEVITEALNEIGENPLFSSLVLTAKDQSSYEQLSQYMENNFKNEIDRTNYGKNKEVIGRLGAVTATMQKVGLIVGSVFIFIAIMVTFSAIRMSLYTRKKEFDIMRLVGASNLYIKIPPILEGIYYGIFAALVAMILIFVLAYSGIPIAEGVISKEEMLNFYIGNLWKIGGLVLLSGILIGIVSSMISIRKYLKL